jgi:hypothetical protein
MTHIRRKTIVVLAAALAASGCTANVESGKGGEAVLETRSALGDPLTAYNGATVAVATNEDTIMAVWQAGNSNPQIIGEAFNQTDGSPRITDPTSNQYSLVGSPGTLPAVAGETASGLNHFLIVWQRNWSSTDQDILAQFASDDGTPVPGGNFVIENDDQPEDSPAVALIPDLDQWLVTYTRKDTNGVTSLMARWVDVFGKVTPDPSTPAITIVSGGVHIPKGRNTISSCAGTITAMFTYNDNQVVFATVPDPQDVVVGTPNSISGATGLVGACNDAVGQFGLAWLQGTSKVGTRVFGSGCTQLSCATPTHYFITTGNGVTSVNLPVIAPFDFGFGVAAGLHPSSLQELAFADIDNGNNLVATFRT